MGFVRLNRALNELRKVMLDTTFILDYMPIAPEGYTKVYLAGLAFSSTDDNELEGIALALDMDKQTVLDAFGYWQTQELVSVTAEPPQVEYLPVIPAKKRIPKFSKTKYKAFNDQLHVLLKDRPISMNEYNEYYMLMETTGLEIEAMLIIIAYCIRIKGAAVRPQYITAVARNLIREKGYKTYERVSEHLSELDLVDADLIGILGALKLSRQPDHNDKELLVKWKKEFGFPLATIVVIAKRVKKGGMAVLDALLTRYYENRIFSQKEIDMFEANRDTMYSLVKELAKTLGARIERYDTVIEAYLAPWLNLGFTENALRLIADYCFRRKSQDERPFENMNHYIERFYKQGLISAESIQEFLQESVAENEKVKALLEQLGLSRMVLEGDRKCYKTWTRDWNMGSELIDYACELSRDKSNPFGYMNAVLSAWREKKIVSLADAKAQNHTGQAPVKSGTDTPVAHGSNSNLVNRALSAEELNAMFERLEENDL